MVHEVRRIVLNEHELLSAIESYRRITPHYMPEGKVTSCKIEALSHIVVVLEITAGNSKQNIEVKISPNDILKPLIRFCIENNIMMPRDGSKAAVIDKQGIILCITLDLNIDLGETVNPMRTSHLSGLNTKESHSLPDVVKN